MVEIREETSSAGEHSNTNDDRRNENTNSQPPARVSLMVN